MMASVVTKTRCIFESYAIRQKLTSFGASHILINSRIAVQGTRRLWPSYKRSGFCSNNDSGKRVGSVKLRQQDFTSRPLIQIDFFYSWFGLG